MQKHYCSCGAETPHSSLGIMAHYRSQGEKGPLQQHLKSDAALRDSGVKANGASQKNPADCGRTETLGPLAVRHDRFCCSSLVDREGELWKSVEQFPVIRNDFLGRVALLRDASAETDAAASGS